MFVLAEKRKCPEKKKKKKNNCQTIIAVTTHFLDSNHCEEAHISPSLEALDLPKAKSFVMTMAQGKKKCNIISKQTENWNTRSSRYKYHLGYGSFTVIHHLWIFPPTFPWYSADWVTACSCCVTCSSTSTSRNLLPKQLFFALGSKTETISAKNSPLYHPLSSGTWWTSWTFLLFFGIKSHISRLPVPPRRYPTAKAFCHCCWMTFCCTCRIWNALDRCVFSMYNDVQGWSL